MGEPIHIAITRRVRKEHAGEFQAALAEFARRSLSEPGTVGVHCMHPAPGSDSAEFGILRSFASAADRDAFYESPLYKEWLERIKPMIEGDPAYRRLDGLEAWFYNPQSPLPPPKWKMALVTWFAVVMLLLLLNPLFALLFHSFPYVAQVFAGNAILVPILTWIVMPALTRLLAGWLFTKPART